MIVLRKPILAHKRLKQGLSVVLFLALSIALVFYLYQNRTDFQGLFHLDPSLVIWILCFAFGGCMMNAYYHKLLLDTYHIPLTLTDWVGVVSIANVIAYVVPLRMDLLFSAAYYKRTKNLAYGKSASMAAGNVVFGIAFSVLQMLIALLCLGFVDGVWSYPLWGVTLLLTLGLFVLIAGSIMVEKKKFSFLLRFAILNKIINGFNALLRNRQLLWRLVFCLASNNLFHLFLYMACFRGIGLEVKLYEALLYSAISRMITLVAIVPGNIGIKEAIMGIATVLMGTIFENGVAVSLLHRVALMSIHFAMALGFAIPVMCNWKKGIPHE